ncbi:GNAT family N-acetyltransferase [Pedobacter yulinensis]|uniref:GNAT family N-acetyltransferase n=1 Tax=Pedobacter yulinensis TaxID=2126353 RepID=A0A2T3HHX9_9SPHI|nr:GNAT family N-acetyltransferase [Pedobacter yulinensis]PST81981.1 GNAT family N-acetyltransferase [Pedobacter yulinensis]
MDITLRPAELADLDMLLEFARDIFYSTFIVQNDEADMRAYMEQAFTQERWRNELEAPDSVFYLALAGTDLAGYMKLNLGEAQTELKEQYALEIERIYVAAAYQGRSLASRLMDHTLKIAAHIRPEFVWLGVWEHNARAIRFYEKNGFSTFDRHVFMLGKQQQTDLMMKKEPEWKPEKAFSGQSFKAMLREAGL